MGVCFDLSLLVTAQASGVCCILQPIEGFGFKFDTILFRYEKIEIVQLIGLPGWDFNRIWVLF